MKRYLLILSIIFSVLLPVNSFALRMGYGPVGGGSAGGGVGDMATATYDIDADGVLNPGAIPDLSGVYQPFDADLTTYAGITPSVDVQTLLGSVSFATFVSNLGITASIAELNYVTGVTGLIQNLLDAKCDESVFGTTVGDGLLKSGNDLVLDLTDPHTWTGVQTFADMTITKKTSAPTPVTGTVYRSSGAWDPAGLGIGKDYYDIYDGANYIPLFDEDGDHYFSAIQRPSYAHFVDADAIYNDNTTPHVLTTNETKGFCLTNAGANEDKVYSSHAYDFGMDFDVKVIAAYQMDLEPPSGGKIWLDGVEYAADEHIINDDDTEGDWMHCQSVEISDEIHELHCNSMQGHWHGAGGDDSIINYGATSVTTGFTNDPTPEDKDDIFYTVDGNKVFVTVEIRGVSNDTDFSFTLPFASETTTTHVLKGVDNNAVVAGGVTINIAAGASTANCYAGYSVGDVWTNTNDKAIYGTFWYFIDDGI